MKVIGGATFVRNETPCPPERYKVIEEVVFVKMTIHNARIENSCMAETQSRENTASQWLTQLLPFLLIVRIMESVLMPLTKRLFS